MNQQNRAVPIAPAHDPARVHALEVALSRHTSPDGWKDHTLSQLLDEAETIWAYITAGTVPSKES